MPLAAVAAMGIGSVVSGVLGAHAAGNAADTQVAAANHAADLQKQSADQALAFQKQVYGQQQKDIAPWLKAGTGAITDLSTLLAPGGELSQGWTGQFQAPTADQAAQTPGFQFQMQEGQKAIERSAAARGGLLSGGTAKALDQYGQGLASTNYQQTYNNALTQYQQSYNQFQQDQANRYNRLAGISGAGQTAAGQLGTAGSQAAGNVGNILLSSGQQIGQSLNNAGAARASGYIGQANAYGNTFSNLASLYPLYQGLQQG